MSCLWVGSTSIASRGSNRPTSATVSRNAASPSLAQPEPAGLVGHGRARDDEDAFRRSSVGRLEDGSRAPPGGPARSPGPARPGARARSPRSRGPPRGPGCRAAIAGALVATMPLPMATSPRARRVMSRQPDGRDATGPRASRRRGSVGVPATASTSAAATTERQVADPGHGLVVGGGGHPDRPRADRPGEGLDALDRGRRPGPGRRPTVDRRTGPRSTRRSRRWSGPAIGWPPT